MATKYHVENHEWTRINTNKVIPGAGSTDRQERHRSVTLPINRFLALAENHEWTRINTNKVVPGAVLRTGRSLTVQ